MWPRDAYSGQHVVALRDVVDPNTGAKLTKGTVYTVYDVVIYRESHVYIGLSELPDYYAHHSILKPVDPAQIDVFRRMLKNVPNDKVMDRSDA